MMELFLLAGAILTTVVGVISFIKWWCSEQVEYFKLTNKNKRAIYDGNFLEGVHDHLYTMGMALVSNVVFIESSVSPSSRVIRKALVMLSKRYPMLRMKFEWIEGVTHRYLTEMKDPHYIEFLDEDHFDAESWPERLEEELLRSFDVKVGPLWRVIRLKEQYNDADNKYKNTLLFTYHHSICDGISMMALYDRFLEYLDVDDVNRVESMSLLPRLPDLIKHHTTLPWWKACLFKLKLKWTQVTQMIKTRSTKNIYLQNFPAVKENPFTTRKTCVIPRNLSKEETLQLIRHCKANRCTVTGTLMAITAVAVRQIIQGGGMKLPLELSIGTAVNIRDECQPPVSREHLGCFVSFLLVTLRLPKIYSLKADFWRTAQQLSEMIQNGLKNKEHFTFYKMLKYRMHDPVEDFTKLSENVDNAGRRLLVGEFSNRGRFECRKQKFQLSGCHFAVAQHLGGGLFANNIVTVNDQLYYTLVYSSHVMTRDQAEEYISLVFRVLKEVCSN